MTTAQPAAAAICPKCGMFITGAFWPDDHQPTAAENLADHLARTDAFGCTAVIPKRQEG